MRVRSRRVWRAWLAADPAIWLALAQRDDVELRHAAASELRSLDESVEFDPYASSEERQRQLAVLSKRFEKLAPPPSDDKSR